MDSVGDHDMASDPKLGCAVQQRHSKSTGAMAGNCVVITGAASDLGSTVSERLARAGASLVLADGDDLALTALAQQLEDNYDAPVVTSLGDLGAAGAVERVAQQAVGIFGGIDVLVSISSAVTDVAGAPGAGNTGDVLMCRRLWLALRSALSALPVMLTAGRGRMILVNGAELGGSLEQRTAHAVAAGGVHALVSSLADEFGASGVTFSCVDALAGHRTADTASDAEEVAAVIESLAHDSSAITNGQIFRKTTRFHR